MILPTSKTKPAHHNVARKKSITHLRRYRSQNMSWGEYVMWTADQRCTKQQPQNLRWAPTKWSMNVVRTWSAGALLLCSLIVREARPWFLETTDDIAADRISITKTKGQLTPALSFLASGAWHSLEDHKRPLQLFQEHGKQTKTLWLFAYFGLFQH